MLQTLLLFNEPFSFGKAVKDNSEIKSDFSAFNIIIRVAATVKTDQFKTFVYVKAYCICIAGLSFKNNGAALLVHCLLFCDFH